MTSPNASEPASPSSPNSTEESPSFEALLAEGWAAHVNPPVEDTFERLGYVPTERQRLFHDATEFDVFYGGAAGGGKTKALLMDDLRDCVRHPGIQVWEFRRSYPELRDSFVRELADVGFARDLGGHWVESRMELRFDNGSLLQMRYAENVSDATRYLSAQMQKLTIDERTTMDPEVIARLGSRVRSGSASIPVIGIRSGSNPGSVGHADVKTRYITATDHGAKVITDERRRSVRFIPAKITDNPHLNAEYIDDLEGLPENLRAAYRDGSWDTFAGQVFGEWSYHRHVVPTFTPPASWQRFCGIDWGYAAPHSVHWAAVDDGRAYVYRELYGTGVGEADLARDILCAEGALTDTDLIARHPDERVRLRLADPSMWNKIADANPIAATFAAEGCTIVKATNDRLAGVQRVHSYLDEAPACAIHRKAGWATCPRLHVMECAPNLIRTLPALPYDEKRPEDVDTDAEDHAYDSLRYLLMHLPLPRVGREPKAEPANTQERIAAHLAERARRKRAAHVIGAY